MAKIINKLWPLLCERNIFGGKNRNILNKKLIEKQTKARKLDDPFITGQDIYKTQNNLDHKEVHRLYLITNGSTLFSIKVKSTK